MYRKLDTKMWTDPKVKKLSPEAKLLFCYLITNHHTHLAGIYYLPESVAVMETGLTQKKVRACMKELSVAGLCRFDTESAVVWVVNMLRYQGRGAKIEKAVENQIASLHACPLIQCFLEHNHTLSIPYRYPIEGVSPQEKDQDQEKEKKQETPPAQKTRSALSLLLDEKIPEQIAQDFLELRKKHKAPLTATALKGIKNQAKVANLTLTAALEICCARGWRGFKAEWLDASEKGKPPKQPQKKEPPVVTEKSQESMKKGAAYARSILKELP